MERFEPGRTLREIARTETREYIYDMVEQLAKLARRSGDIQIAIHLEAIGAIRRAIAEDRVAG